MRKIVVIGSTNTDMVVKSERIPVPGETVLGGTFLMNPGGKGANQAVAAARLGGDVVFVAKVGNDLFGKAAKALFEEENIRTDYIFVDEKAASGVALIMVDRNGENSISVALGANGELKESDLESVCSEIESASILLMQLETPVSTVLQAAKMAAANGVTVVLNPAPAADLPLEIYRYLTVITPNETEAELLTGVKVIDEETALQAAQKLSDRGVKSVIITMGSKGAFMYHSGKHKIFSVEKVTRVDTTAAGDVFNGALTVALSEGRSLEEAIIFGGKASTLSVQRMGAQTSAPYRDEIV